MAILCLPRLGLSVSLQSKSVLFNATTKTLLPKYFWRCYSETNATTKTSPASVLLKVGIIEDVKLHPDAQSLYVSTISLGNDEPPRTVCSGLVGKIPKDQLLNKAVVLVCNLKPAKLRGVLSEAMVLAAEKDDQVELLIPPYDSKPGQLLYFDGYKSVPPQTRIKPKVWQTIQRSLYVNSFGIVVYKDEEGQEHRLILKDALDDASPTTTDSLIDASIR